jgi:hypothetical protein
VPSTTAEREATPHGMPVHEVVLLAETDADTGLSGAAAGARLVSLGPNRLPERRGPGRLRRMLAQFHNPLIYVLLGAAALTAALGETVDASVVLGASASRNGRPMASYLDAPILWNGSTSTRSTLSRVDTNDAMPPTLSSASVRPGTSTNLIHVRLPRSDSRRANSSVGATSPPVTWR